MDLNSVDKIGPSTPSNHDVEIEMNDANNFQQQNLIQFQLPSYNEVVATVSKPNISTPWNQKGKLS